ncbi:MAG: ATP/GTP-binding protein, partial [Pseudolysinimonas sp.]
MEHVILFAGPMGAGKTTAIKSLSDIPVISTEAANSDRQTADKATTTVALDYGEILVSDEEKIRLYGIPGQRRFDFMWRVLRDRAEGMVLLVNNDGPDPVDAMREFMIEFADLCDR